MNTFTLPIRSCLVGKQKWGSQVCACWNCGFSPVRHEVTLDNGNKEFCYSCPNIECGAASMSPPRKAWSTSKQVAADYWNTANMVRWKEVNL
jgi:hypothetical protein